MMANGDAIGNLAELMADILHQRRPVPPPPGIDCLPSEVVNANPVRKAWWSARRLADRAKSVIWGQELDEWHRDDILDHADMARRQDRWAKALG